MPCECFQSFRWTELEEERLANNRLFALFKTTPGLTALGLAIADSTTVGSTLNSSIEAPTLDSITDSTISEYVAYVAFGLAFGQVVLETLW